MGYLHLVTVTNSLTHSQSCQETYWYRHPLMTDDSTITRQSHDPSPHPKKKKKKKNFFALVPLNSIA